MFNLFKFNKNKSKFPFPDNIDNFKEERNLPNPSRKIPMPECKPPKEKNDNKIYNVLKESMLNLGVEKSDIEYYMRNNEFTISFGLQDVWENRNGNPQLVKKEAMSIKTKWRES